MNIGEKRCGFTIKGAVTHPDLGGTLWKMTHDKTGAALVWLDNGEENKLFSVAFKTIPQDDTGVFHILEHSVLCGSEHYPVKEPFLDLLKSSMNTFLNAMTFPDKTMYPVSSRNEQDFLNLTGVYLDAVFCPAIYQKQDIFRQEGWHYELAQGETVPTFKGVVFNEMKGAYSSVERLVDEEICRQLFPDTCYQFSSGGDPEAIPNLTYEDFLAAHREFYHPTNARFWLDGAVPLEKTLNLIDSYLRAYEKSDKVHEIPLQTPTQATEVVKYYEIGADEPKENKVQMGFGRLLCDWSDRKKAFAASALSTYLTGSNAAPLKRAILEKGLAQDAWFEVNNGIAQTYTLFRVRGSEYENREAIKQTVKETVLSLIETGLDREELEANINQLEFSLRETEEPKGIERAICSLMSWLYGGQPEEYLIFGDVIDDLRAALDTDYFKDLLGEMFLDDAHTSALYALPSVEEGARKRQVEADRLVEAAKDWTDADRDAIRAMNEALEAWQMSEDTPEALATIPTLSLDDIGDPPAPVPTEVIEVGQSKILYHAVPTGSVLHARLYFAVNDAPATDLAPLSFLATLLGELPTDKYDVVSLKKQIKKIIGRLNFDVNDYPTLTDPDRATIYFIADMSLLTKNAKEAFDLVAHILTCTKFDDANAIRELLLQEKEGMYQRIIGRGNRYALTHSARNFSASGLAGEMLGGFSYYDTLRTWASAYDTCSADLQKALNAISKTAFVSSRLTLSITSDTLPEEAKALPATFPLGATSPDFFTPELTKEPLKEAIKIPAGVSFAAITSHLSRHETAYSGKLAMLSGLLSYGYLWTEIRVKGGAYGCGFGARRTGTLLFSTFRDPTPLRSLDIMKDTSAFLTSFVDSEESVDKYIISSISSMEPLLSASQKGALADEEHFVGITRADNLARRNEMLTMQKPDLLTLCPLFDAVAASPSICIIAHEGVIETLDEGWTVKAL